VWRSLRAVWRLVRCVLQLGWGVLQATVRFPFLTPAQRLAYTGHWCRRMAHVLGVEVESSGLPQAGPLLVAANHISWFDILAINAVLPARFVSKADVRRWPLLGWMVASGGTLFIERERKRDALRVVHQIAEALQQGDVIAMFPEGTTGDGRSLLPFHGNLLQAAIATGSPVQPIALRYADSAGPLSNAVVWVGDTTLVTSLWQVAVADGLRAHVTLLPVLPSAQRDRRDLSHTVRVDIAQALGVPADT
jgi:1-acyl-sn-glycerol-3-phosphate acyltransferase